MKKYLLVLCSVLWSGPAAGEVILLDGAAAGISPRSAGRLVQQHLEQLRARGAVLRFTHVDAVPGGRAFRFQQVHAGLPVLHARATVLVLGGRLTALTSSLQSLGSNAAPARRLTRQAAQQALVDAVPTARVRHASRAIWTGGGALGAAAREVWVLDVMTHSPLGLWEAYIDAGTGKLLSGRSTMQHVKGQVYSTNPTVGQLVTKDLLRLTKKTALDGTYAKAQRCKIVDQTKVTCDVQAKPDTNGDFIYKPKEPSIDDPFAEVQGYFHVDQFHNWLSSSFGFKRQGDQRIDVVVNLHMVQGSGSPQGYPNAFFGDLNGDKKGDLCFGQSSRDFVYDADVIYHEFTHSAVGETSKLTLAFDNLGANVSPMALNEGFADLMSSVYTNDHIVGDYSKAGGIRQLKGNASCPKWLSGESHQDGLIWAHAVWAVRATLSDTKAYDKALYTTMATLASSAGFADADTLFRQILKAADPTLEAKAAAEFKKRGLTGCSRFIPLTENLSRQGYIYGKRMVMGAAVFPFGYQYTIKVPKDAESLTLYIKGHGWGGGGSIGAYLRSGQPVQYSYSNSTYDLIKSNTTTTLVVDKNSKAPLVPGSTYYVLPLNAGNQTTVFNITYQTKLKAPPQPDISLPPDMGTSPDQTPPNRQDAAAPRADWRDDSTGLTDRSGCSCELQGTAGGSSLLLVGLLLGLLGWRRRRA